jgi:NAD-dependent dihydropyrimidine dehydrogenase PreA subunit
MQIRVNPEKCNGCGVCVDICPCDVFRPNPETGLAEGTYEEDCWYCGACEMDCPTQAIIVDLPYLVS